MSRPPHGVSSGSTARGSAGEFHYPSRTSSGAMVGTGGGGPGYQYHTPVTAAAAPSIMAAATSSSHHAPPLYRRVHGDEDKINQLQDDQQHTSMANSARQKLLANKLTQLRHFETIMAEDDWKFRANSCNIPPLRRLQR